MAAKKIDVTEILGCVEVIHHALELINATPNNSKLLRIYRGSALKEFEIVLEQTGRLLRQALSYQTEKSTKSLSYKDVFRQAVTSMLISPEEAERWFEYRDLRNESAHEYGQDMAKQLFHDSNIPIFIQNHDWANLPDSFQRNIEDHAITFFTAKMP